MPQTWWQIQIDMEEDYKDLEWGIYNFEWTIDDKLEEDEFGPMSEQVWAVREGIGMGVS